MGATCTFTLPTGTWSTQYWQGLADTKIALWTKVSQVVFYLFLCYASFEYYTQLPFQCLLVDFLQIKIVVKMRKHIIMEILY